MTQYAGIDYGLGQSNIDKETGIRFGVIAQNSINLDILSEFDSEYGEPHCPECGNEIKASDDESVTDAEWNDGKDYACADCEQCFWSDVVFADEALGISYEQDGYQITDCLDLDLFVLKSPFYTFAQFCSPCVPGALNLDCPLDRQVSPADGQWHDDLNQPRAYCLGHDWFDSDKAPYRVFRVADNMEVLPELA